MCLVAPFTVQGRAAPRWVRVALWLLGPISFVWSIIGFTLLFGSGSISEHTYYFIRHIKTLFAGMGIGILLLLFASGEFVRDFSRPKP